MLYNVSIGIIGRDSAVCNQEVGHLLSDYRVPRYVAVIDYVYEAYR